MDLNFFTNFIYTSFLICLSFVIFVAIALDRAPSNPQLFGSDNGDYRFLYVIYMCNLTLNVWCNRGMLMTSIACNDLAEILNVDKEKTG